MNEPSAHTGRSEKTSGWRPSECRGSSGLLASAPSTVTAAPTRQEKLRERLANPLALLSRIDLRDLGLERRAVDSVFRGCPNVYFDGYSRPLIRVRDFDAYIERCTYRDGERVR